MSLLHEYPERVITGYASPNEILKYRTDLHYYAGTSDKVYIVCIVEQRTSLTYRCFALYGRRGSNLTMSDQGTFPTESMAQSKAASVISEKTKKGYSKVGHEFYPQTQASSQAAPTQHFINPEVLAFHRFKIGAMARLEPAKDDKKIKQILNNKNLIIEPYSLVSNATTPFYYIIFDIVSNNQRGWHIFRGTDDNKALATELELLAYNPAYAEKQKGTIFAAYATDEDKLALFDIYWLGESQSNISTRPWTVRRTILTEVYAQLFPTRDPYDTSYFCHLSDYVYEDKEEYIRQNPGTYVARGIDTTIKAGTNIFTL